jgi:hypothetical protein
MRAVATLKLCGRSKDMSILDDLERRLTEARAAGDTETAELLEGAIARIKSGESNLTEQQPGRMGLGSSQERYASQGARVLPKKPDPMTKGHRPGGRRR